jgi:hypothetical protein
MGANRPHVHGGLLNTERTRGATFTTLGFKQVAVLCLHAGASTLL